MAAGALLYQEVVQVTYTYLGPAADRFVSRQIANHLSKQPSELTLRDLPELIDWMRLAMGFLSEDEVLVDDYASRLASLDQRPKRKPIARKRQKVGNA